MSGLPYRPPRPLDPVELRVLGCLIEKELSSPNTYPLSLNALTAAANQKSNRDPVLDLDERAIQAALDSLLPEVLVWRVRSARVPKWQHNLDSKWDLGVGGKALLAELLLRGEQTPGELRARASRMREFDELDDVLATLARLTDLGLVEELDRQPGQKETRWRQLLGNAATPSPASAGSPSPPTSRSGSRDLVSRLEVLEARVDELAAALRALRDDMA